MQVLVQFAGVVLIREGSDSVSVHEDTVKNEAATEQQQQSEEGSARTANVAETEGESLFQQYSPHLYSHTSHFFSLFCCCQLCFLTCQSRRAAFSGSQLCRLPPPLHQSHCFKREKWKIPSKYSSASSSSPPPGDIKDVQVPDNIPVDLKAKLIVCLIHSKVKAPLEVKRSPHPGCSP